MSSVEDYTTIKNVIPVEDNANSLHIENYGRKKLVIIPASLDIKKRYSKLIGGTGARWCSNLKDSRGMGWIVDKDKHPMISDIVSRINTDEHKQSALLPSNAGRQYSKSSTVKTLPSDMSDVSKVNIIKKTTSNDKMSSIHEDDSSSDDDVDNLRTLNEKYNKIDHEKNDLLVKLRELKSKSENKSLQDKFHREGSVKDSDSEGEPVKNNSKKTPSPKARKSTTTTRKKSYSSSDYDDSSSDSESYSTNNNRHRSRNYRYPDSESESYHKVRSRRQDLANLQTRVTSLERMAGGGGSSGGSGSRHR